MWAPIIMALLSLDQIVKPLEWVEACSHAGSSGFAMTLRTSRPSAVDSPEYVDPWRLSATGKHLGPEFGLAVQGVPLLR